ncbi:MAG: ATP-binding cassette domain-containing protein [Eubacteriaceae bacterium]|nr:ATP-binding cassette domain-containing protein [Eubacteriaceae bacterium]
MLELNGITYEVEEDGEVKRILEDINLKIDNSFTAITGPNGGGKSTLAKLIAGIITPTKGSLILDGKDITGYNITQRAQEGISYAFQSPVKFKGIVVKDLIAFAAGRKVGLDEACDYLSAVGLCARDYVNREVNSSLSGGELKRIEIATVLARGTKISIFDEPEAGIDLWSFNSLIRVFESLYSKINGAIVLISHQERILNIADNIIVLEGGRVKQFGKRDEVLPDLMGVNVACKAAEREGN